MKHFFPIQKWNGNQWWFTESSQTQLRSRPEVWWSWWIPNWPNPSRERMDSPTLSTSSRSQLKALPQNCISAQLVWMNRRKCGGILIAILKNEPTDLYTPDPLSNGSNYQSLMLEFPGMGLSSQTETNTDVCLQKCPSAFTESTVHRIFGN